MAERKPESQRRNRDVEVIPSDRSLIVMGNSYDAPPTAWRTHQATCVGCGSGFVVCAAEQQFWYERLRIPYAVSINRCPSCRAKQRAHRGIIARLSALLPRIDSGQADAEELRDAVLTIADGMSRRVVTRGSRGEPVLAGPRIIEKGSALVAALRRTSPRHDDLLPVQIRFQRRLGHADRAARLSRELEAARARSATMAKAIRHVELWLADPSQAMRERIAEPPRS